MHAASHLDTLNQAQRAAVTYGLDDGAAAPPLLIIAGAGSGKTTTLAHRVAELLLHGADPQRVLMLTFTRRAAEQMRRRAARIIAHCRTSAGRGSGAAGEGGAAFPSAVRLQWSGTFHAVANRLLRLHAGTVGLDPAFTVLDRSDAADLIDVVRHELGLATKRTRFPRKATCLAIYSHTVNARHPIEETLETAFPWCADWSVELKKLFAAYVAAKQKQNVLDYDDLLLYWYHMMAEPGPAAAVAERFDHVLVDEYQDTNVLQASILHALKPDGHGVTVVGDDAQSIYSFRAATVRNILDFPAAFSPPAAVVTLEQNYRSTEPILEACNRVIGLASERFTKNLFSTKASKQKPCLVTVDDETAQVDYVVEQVLERREAGIDLKRQAVLFRTSHHSDALEVELARRDIPFVKFGGLKFLEAAHVKDVICVLRWAENPRDQVAAFRVLQLLPGMGPATARRALDGLAAGGFAFSALRSVRVAPVAAQHWPGLCDLLAGLYEDGNCWQGQFGRVRDWYEPYLESLYDAAHVRAGDIEQLERMAAGYPSRERFLTDLTLDPPAAAGDEAGVPMLDEDYLILSTIHSAKGQEWEAVYILNAADGCIPSDMATGAPEQIEEERRLLYVAMTRARGHLDIVHPLRFFVRQQHRYGDRHVFTPRSRFLPDEILGAFDCRSYGDDCRRDGTATRRPVSEAIDVGAQMRAMWR